MADSSNIPKPLMFKMEIDADGSNPIPIFIIISPKGYPISLQSAYNGAVKEKCKYMSITTFNSTAENAENCWRRVQNNIPDLDLIDLMT